MKRKQRKVMVRTPMGSMKQFASGEIVMVDEDVAAGAVELGWAYYLDEPAPKPPLEATAKAAPENAAVDYEPEVR